MDRDEILAKSKRENAYGDEREKEIRVKRDAFSLWGFIICGIVIMILKLVRAESPADIISLMFCVSGLGFAYDGVKLRRGWIMAAGIVFLLLSAYFFYRFCMGLF